MSKMSALAVMAVLVLMNLAVASAQTRTECQSITAGDLTFHELPMRIIAEQTESDPHGIWTQLELWNPNTPLHTIIWEGTAAPCEGEIIISQIQNRQCSSATSCPVRVVLRTAKGNQVLLDYKQVCTIRQQFELRGDARELRACGQIFVLDKASTDVAAAEPR
jgi:hypothetical protein